MEKTAVLAITKNGVKIGQELKQIFPDWSVFAPSKFSSENNEITWYSEPASEKIVDLFKNILIKKTSVQALGCTQPTLAVNEKPVVSHIPSIQLAASGPSHSVPDYKTMPCNCRIL